jgi:hypothetical protein
VLMMTWTCSPSLSFLWFLRLHNKDDDMVDRLLASLLPP